jgi:hypothetical protein
MPSLKEDASFREFLALGETATKRTQEYLNDLGHNIIELERGALSSRRWEYKEKRLRIPDLLCVNCGRTIESRGKKSLEITMSHSTSDEEREWDAGADDEDLIAFVKCTKNGELPTDWEPPESVNIMSYGNLREVEDQTKQDRAGPTQGSELTITWPSVIPSADGTIKKIDLEDMRLQVSRGRDGYTLSYSLEKKIADGEYAELKPLVEKGDSVNGEEEIIAAPAELESEDNIECEHSYSIDQYLSDIESGSFEEKFAAVKALGFCDYDNNAESVLREVVDDQSENYFLRLEAAGSLARHGVDKGYEFLKGNARLSSTVSDPEEDASKRLEALLILREVGGQEAGKVLAENLRNEDELVELRAQAAACIGEINQPEFAEALLSAFEYRHKKIKDDAIEALAKLDKTGVETALEGLSSNSEDKQIGSAIALAVMDGVSIEDIIAHVEDNEVSEKWLSFAFGLREMDEVAENMESTEALDQDVAFGSEVVSSIFNSWADPLSQVIRIKLRRDLEGNNDNGQRDLSEF